MTIRKSIRIERAPAVTFRAFCEEIGRWWPSKKGFSFGGERANDLLMEGRVGGRFFERYTDGTEFEIGRVEAYEPPRLVAFTWRAPKWEAPTRVEVRFTPDGAGTRVDLEHSGWEQGAVMGADQKGYTGGWEMILREFQLHAAAAA
jgi:uncharacterized protein YndB with AHSA1/START domain